MFFEKIDYLSSGITLFHRRKDKHSSIISGFLAMLSYLLIISCAIYYIVIFFKRTTFSTYFYKRYSDEKISMTFSDNKFFHYVSFNREINDSIINIIGVESPPNLYTPGKTIGYPSLHPVNEYIYEKCTPEDMKNNENLISNIEEFLKSYCIHKMYDYKTKKIIDKTDSNFISPKIDNINISVYSIIIKKCSNDETTTGYKRNCASDEVINTVNFESYSTYFHFVDRYVDVGNYINPVKDYNYYKEIGLKTGNNFLINKINIHNVLINSHEGYLFDSIKKTNTLVFENNEAAYNDGTILTNGILCSAEYWNDGRTSVYERKYQTILDVFSNIGGTFKIIISIFNYINFFINRFTVYNDSIDIYFETKKNFNVVKNDASNFQGKNNINIKDRNKINNKKTITNLNQLYFNEQDSNSDSSKAKTNLDKYKKNSNICPINEENNNKDLEEQKLYKINFCKYIYLLITKCRSNNSKNFFKYCDLREEIISEEFLYRLYFELMDQNTILNKEKINENNFANYN